MGRSMAEGVSIGLVYSSWLSVVYYCDIVDRKQLFNNSPSRVGLVRSPDFTKAVKVSDNDVRVGEELDNMFYIRESKFFLIGYIRGVAIK